ncbi:MAG: septal ring lytic transglycosylase RlpA family protein [Puia sp.]|nr:septal ring lytic transglycosylase RlpA family protein [Puia sp.]
MHTFTTIALLGSLVVPVALSARQEKPRNIPGDSLIASIDTVSFIADSTITVYENTVETDTDNHSLSDSLPARSARKRHKPIKTQYGIASFYSNKFEGRKTYTDEIFSQKKLSAASNTLPMRTWIKVTNLRNHRSVILRINDRMHPRNRRLIDLSRAAARKLGFTGSGLARVRVDVIGRRRPPEALETTGQ